MRYYKNVRDGYILGIGEYGIGIEIAKDEYDEIVAIIRTAPTSPDGYVYMLRNDNLTWELVELTLDPELDE